MDVEDAERVLAKSPHHRVLKRIPALEDWKLAAPAPESALRRAVFVDVESTGLNPEHDEVIELALLPFDYDRDSGEIVRVHHADSFNAFRQPSFPIPADSTRIHAITDADVAGREIQGADVERVLRGAHLIIAHNAGFDRPMTEKHWPAFEALHWACSLSDIRWQDEGLGSGKLDYLLMRQGWFFAGHRALTDAMAGVFLLSRRLPVSGTSAMAALLECARRPLKAVRAEGAPFEARAALKARGYRWDAGDDTRSKAWWRMTDDAENEARWLDQEIYAGASGARIVSVPATRRYSARLWS